MLKNEWRVKLQSFKRVFTHKHRLINIICGGLEKKIQVMNCIANRDNSQILITVNVSNTFSFKFFDFFQFFHDFFQFSFYFQSKATLSTVKEAMQHKAVSLSQSDDFVERDKRINGFCSGLDATLISTNGFVSAMENSTLKILIIFELPSCHPEHTKATFTYVTLVVSAGVGKMPSFSMI